MSDNSKLIKNAERGKSIKVEPYVPQHVLHGIKPTEPISHIKTNSPAILETKAVENVVQKTSALPYAEEGFHSQTNIGMGTLPKFSNKQVEKIWSEIDDKIADQSLDEDLEEIDLDLTHPVVDNSLMSEITEVSSDDINSEIFDNLEGEYLLFISNKFCASGSLETIQDFCNKLYFDDPNFKKIMSIKEILVLKKMKIQVGLHLG